MAVAFKRLPAVTFRGMLIRPQSTAGAAQRRKRETWHPRPPRPRPPARSLFFFFYRLRLGSVLSASLRLARRRGAGEKKKLTFRFTCF